MGTPKKSQKADRKVGGGGVNAYGQPDRKIPGFFLHLPLVTLLIIEDEDFHLHLVGDLGNLFVFHHVEDHLVNYDLDNYCNILLYHMDSIDKKVNQSKSKLTYVGRKHI